MKTGGYNEEQKYERNLLILTDKIDKLESIVKEQSETINLLQNKIFDKFDQVLKISNKNRCKAQILYNQSNQKSNVSNTDYNDLSNNGILVKSKSNVSMKRLKPVVHDTTKKFKKKNTDTSK